MSIYDMYKKNILEHGQAVQGVMGEPSFFYTIGNHEKDLPELLTIGPFSPQTITAMLNEVGDRMRATGKAPDEGLLDIDWSFPVMIRKCGPRAKTEFTIQAGEYYSTQDYDVMQVMICDPHGKYPGDPEIEPAYMVEMP